MSDIMKSPKTTIQRFVSRYFKLDKRIQVKSFVLYSILKNLKMD